MREHYKPIGNLLFSCRRIADGELASVASNALIYKFPGDQNVKLDNVIDNKKKTTTNKQPYVIASTWATCVNA